MTRRVIHIKLRRSWCRRLSSFFPETPTSRAKSAREMGHPSPISTIRRTMKLVRVFVILCLMTCVAGAADRKYINNSRPAGTQNLPFSDAVLVGNTLYIAGTIGLDPKTGMAPADAEQEAHLVMEIGRAH